MKIELDIKNLTENLISCEEFCILQLLYKKQETLLNDYVKACKIDIYNVLNSLADKGYIITAKEFLDFEDKDNIALDKLKIASLLGIAKGDTAFYTFFSTYPQKVPARGGYRALRPATHDAKAAVLLKKKYFTKVGKTVKEQSKVQEILEAELKARKKNNSLLYMPAMEAYLNGFQWEKSEYLLTEKKEIDERKPRKGEQLI